MTIQQLAQVLVALPNDQLLSALYEAEKALHAVTPFIERAASINQQKQDAEKKLAIEQDDKKHMLTNSIIGAVASVISFIISTILPSSNLLGLLLLFVAIGGVVVTAFYVFKFFVHTGNCSKLETTIRTLELQYSEAVQQRDQAVERNAIGLQNLTAVANADLWFPANLRTFISYIETGRAHNLNEARTLFEEYMHRQRMENLAQMQLNAAISARNAAIAAADASKAAAAASQNAQSAANQASFNARYY